MNDFKDFESYYNGIKAEDYAIKVKEYCLKHKNCEECVFFIGTCKLNRFPFDWDFRREYERRDIRSNQK